MPCLMAKDEQDKWSGGLFSIKQPKKKTLLKHPVSSLDWMKLGGVVTGFPCVGFRDLIYFLLFYDYNRAHTTHTVHLLYSMCVPVCLLY